MPSARQERRKETRKQQRIAARAGTASPRALARSVAKAYMRAHGTPENEIGGWRQIVKELQKENRIIKRTVKKVEPGV